MGRTLSASASSSRATAVVPPYPIRDTQGCSAATPPFHVAPPSHTVELQLSWSSAPRPRKRTPRGRNTRLASPRPSAAALPLRLPVPRPPPPESRCAPPPAGA